MFNTYNLTATPIRGTLLWNKRHLPQPNDFRRKSVARWAECEETASGSFDSEAENTKSAATGRYRPQTSTILDCYEYSRKRVRSNEEKSNDKN